MMRKRSDAWMTHIAWRGAEIAAAWRPDSEPAQVPQLTAGELARYIDHTLLKADATPAMLDAICAEAREHGFASVCVNSSHVAHCAEALEGTEVLVGSTVGFPLGAMLTGAKAHEARLAIEAGAGEVDMVLPVGLLKAEAWRRVYEDVAAVVEVCHASRVLCKVILETSLLTDAEKATACLLCVDAGADYVKTATGFGPGGATPADVALMRHVVGHNKGVKAAGGIRTYEDAIAMIAAGATRIGASSGVQILQGAPS
jgi:deoxyribose-phosphate aldolase